MNRTQKQKDIVEELITSVRKAYLNDSITLIETLSQRILELYNQNQLLLNGRDEMDSIITENTILHNLYSNVLVLRSKLRKKNQQKKR